MDLSLSPDFDAYWCYLLVIVFGGVTALRQIITRLGKYPGIWLVWRTWLLFFAYFLIPLLLFWFLDRSGAINDTSLFAAVIVGFGYERILAGSGTVAAPETVSSLWTPFLAYADNVEQQTRDHVFKKLRRFDEQLLAHVVDEPERVDALETLAMNYSEDVEYLKEQLEEVVQESASLGDDVLREKKATVCYEDLTDSEDFHQHLLDKKIVSKAFYYLRAPRVRSRFIAVVVISILLGSVLMGSRQLADPEMMMRYYVWRLEKPATTLLDQYRASDELAAYLAQDQSAAYVIPALARMLRKPGLTVERVNMVLQLLLAQHCQLLDQDGTLPQALIASLRAPNVDVRARIHQALLFLASTCKESISEELKNWSPARGDSTTELEVWINRWRTYWS